MSDPRTCAHVRPNEGARSTLEFRGTMAAPGFGHTYECSLCHDTFIVVGGSVYDPKEDDVSNWEMSPEDCV